MRSFLTGEPYCFLTMCALGQSSSNRESQFLSPESTIYFTLYLAENVSNWSSKFIQLWRFHDDCAYLHFHRKHCLPLSCDWLQRHGHASSRSESYQSVWCLLLPLHVLFSRGRYLDWCGLEEIVWRLFLVCFALWFRLHTVPYSSRISSAWMGNGCQPTGFKSSTYTHNYVLSAPWFMHVPGFGCFFYYYIGSTAMCWTSCSFHLLPSGLSEAIHPRQHCQYHFYWSFRPRRGGGFQF